MMHNGKFKSIFKIVGGGFIPLLIFTGCISLNDDVFTKADLLTQSSIIDFSPIKGEISAVGSEVYYPIPYETPPNLNFIGAESLSLRILKQSAEGFSIMTYQNKNDRTGIEVKWEAQGLPKQKSKEAIGQQPPSSQPATRAR